MCYKVNLKPAYMLNPQFMKGIAALKNYDLAYDILIFPDQLGYTNSCKKNISGYAS